MKNALKFLLVPLFLLAVTSTVQSQLYMDMLAGLHPSIIDDSGGSAHFNAAVGRQVSAKVGYGLNAGAMAVFSSSTNTAFTTLGLQFRRLDNRHHFYGKLEAGSLLSATYTTDGPFTYEYVPKFYPYGRLYLGLRLGRFTMGFNYTCISHFQERIFAFDETSGNQLPTGDFRMRDQHDLQLFIGLSLDSYPVQRRK